MRLRALTSRALVVPAVTAAVLVVAPTAAQAQYECPLKVTSVTYSPNTYDNQAIRESAVTVKATVGFSWITMSMEPGLSGYAELNAVTGRPGTYSGTLNLSPNSKPGVWGPSQFVGHGLCATFTGVKLDGVMNATQIAAAGLAKMTVTQAAPPEGQSRPRVLSFDVPAGPFDATTGGSIPVSVHAVDPGTGLTSVTVSSVSSGVTDLPADATTVSSVALTLTSGTANDGVWTGSLPLIAGTQQSWSYGVLLKNRNLTLGGTDLLPPGVSGFQTFTTTAPPAPTGVKATTPLILPSYTTVTWNGTPAGQPAASSWQVSTAGSCASPVVITTALKSVRITRTASARGTCTVTVRAHNSAGNSAGVSVSATI